MAERYIFCFSAIYVEFTESGRGNTFRARPFVRDVFIENCFSIARRQKISPVIFGSGKSDRSVSRLALFAWNLSETNKGTESGTMRVRGSNSLISRSGVFAVVLCKRRALMKRTRVLEWNRTAKKQLTKGSNARGVGETTQTLGGYVFTCPQLSAYSHFY